MGQEYEVQFAKQLEGADNYGNITYSVKFTTETESVLVRVQPQTAIQPGTKLFGRIEDKVSANGKPYKMFKREQREQFQQGGAYQGAANGGSRAIGGQGSNGKDDRSDGMRQGMSINNATNLISAFISAGLYTDSDPAKVVADLEAFAKGIYAIDLTKQPEVTAEEVETVTDESLLAEIKGLGF
jgi:hypothetical protein